MKKKTAKEKQCTVYKCKEKAIFNLNLIHYKGAVCGVHHYEISKGS